MFKKSAAPASAAAGYTIAKSIRFRSGATAYLTRTQGSGTNRQKYSYSIWAKWSVTDNGQYNAPLYYSTGATSTDALMIEQSPNSVGRLQVYHGDIGYLETTQVLRDPSAWYHFVVIVDTTQATASNRCKLYINGSQVTSFVTANYTGQNVNTSVGESGVVQYIAKQYTYSPARCFDGYMAEYNLIDGQALTQNSFGSTNSTTGVWQPIAYTGTYGSQGFYLKFTDTTSTTTLCYDYSGNSNNFTPNNISLSAGPTYDSMTDVPTLTSATTANYPVINPLDKGTNATVDNGNLRVYSSSGWTVNRATMSYPTTGKYYFEWTYTSNTPAASVGIATSQAASTSSGLGTDAYGWGYQYNGNKYNNNVGTAYGATYTSGDVIGVAFDADAGNLTYYKNNVSQGVAFTGLTTATYFPVSAVAGSSAADAPTINFGQQGFKYTPPTGYVALNTYNLPTSTIVAGNKYMDATTYTGTGANLTVTNTGSFKPDLVWTKDRSSAAEGNVVFDSNRGPLLRLLTDATSAEANAASSLISFNSNGFSLGSWSGSNTNTDLLVAWQWQANQGSTSSNTDGTITSTVNKSTTTNFSVVTYTGNGTNGATVGHGLGVSPNFIIVKRRDSTSYWQTAHSSYTSGYNIILNLTDPQAAATAFTAGGIGSFNSTTFTCTQGLSDSANVNANGGTYVAYCWAAVAGYSAFGSYTGNGSTDGPFIYTGFRPKYVSIRLISGSGYDWYIYDTSRMPYNVAQIPLFANQSAAESANSAFNIDMLSNGFKCRSTYTGNNGNGSTYIYIAYAENPFKNALAR